MERDEECAPGSPRFHLNIYSRVSARGERDPVYISAQKSYCYSPIFCTSRSTDKYRCIDSIECIRFLTILLLN